MHTTALLTVLAARATAGSSARATPGAAARTIAVGTTAAGGRRIVCGRAGTTVVVSASIGVGIIIGAVPTTYIKLERC